MSMDLKGKIVIVTGAARGIGEAAAREYAHQGAKVVLADINSQAQDQIVADLRSQGLEAYCYTCDVAKDDSVGNFAAAVMHDVGVPDLIYNNAVLIRSGSVLDVDLEVLRQQLDVNVIGYLRVSRSFLPAMITRGSGQIAITASPNGINPPPMVSGNISSYCICKAADVSLAQCMAVTLQPLGIIVSLLIPDVTYTLSIHEFTGAASTEFHKRFAHFITNNSVAAEECAKRLVEGLKEGKFFVNAYPGYEPALAAWVQNETDPQVD